MVVAAPASRRERASTITDGDTLPMPNPENLLADSAWRRLLIAALAVLLIAGVVRLLRRAVTQRLQGGAAAYRARRLIGVTAFVVAAIVTLSLLSDRLGGLSVALGVTGAGIAFALQEVIASVAGWFAVSFGRFYAIGDRVQLGGIKGDVIDIGILRTTLMEIGQWVDADLYNGRIVRIANSFVFKEPVFNYSADYPFLWDEIKLPVRYGSDWQHATTVLDSVLTEVCGEFARQSEAAWISARKRYALEDAQIRPVVTMVANENWLELTGRYVVDYRHRRVTKDRLFRRYLAEVDRSAGRIRLASTTLEIVNVPRVEVRRDETGMNIVSRFEP